MSGESNESNVSLLQECFCVRSHLHSDSVETERLSGNVNEIEGKGMGKGKGKLRARFCWGSNRGQGRGGGVRNGAKEALETRMRMRMRMRRWSEEYVSKQGEQHQRSVNTRG